MLSPKTAIPSIPTKTNIRQVRNRPKAATPNPQRKNGLAIGRPVGGGYRVNVG